MTHRPSMLPNTHPPLFRAFGGVQVASGPESTGIFVQMILRVVYSLQFFLIIVLMLLVMFALAFW
jgi:hypothetical protein